MRLLVTLAVRDCLSCPYMSKRLAAAGFIPRMSGRAAPEPARLATMEPLGKNVN